MGANPYIEHGSLPHEAQLIKHGTFLCTDKGTYPSVVEEETNRYVFISITDKTK